MGADEEGETEWQKVITQEKIGGIEGAALPQRRCRRFNVRMIMKNHHHLMNTQEKMATRDRTMECDTGRERACKPGTCTKNIQSENYEINHCSRFLEFYSTHEIQAWEISTNCLIALQNCTHLFWTQETILQTTCTLSAALWDSFKWFIFKKLLMNTSDPNSVIYSTAQADTMDHVLTSLQEGWEISVMRRPVPARRQITPTKP